MGCKLETNLLDFFHKRNSFIKLITNINILYGSTVKHYFQLREEWRGTVTEKVWKDGIGGAGLGLHNG